MVDPRETAVTLTELPAACRSCNGTGEITKVWYPSPRGGGGGDWHPLLVPRPCDCRAVDRDRATLRPEQPIDHADWSAVLATWRRYSPAKRAALLEIAGCVDRTDDAGAGYLAELVRRLVKT